MSFMNNKIRTHVKKPINQELEWHKRVNSFLVYTSEGMNSLPKTATQAGVSGTLITVSSY